MAQSLRYGRTFKTQCAVSVTLTFDLSRSNYFGELTMTPYVSRTLTFTDVVNDLISNLDLKLKYLLILILA